MAIRSTINDSRDDNFFSPADFKELNYSRKYNLLCVPYCTFTDVSGGVACLRAVLPILTNALCNLTKLHRISSLHMSAHESFALHTIVHSIQLHHHLW